MAFQVSPGVLVTEKDLTNVIPAVSTSAGGIVITAEKGPIMRLQLFHLRMSWLKYLVNQMQTTLKNFSVLLTF